MLLRRRLGLPDILLCNINHGVMTLKRRLRAIDRIPVYGIIRQ
jgi:hypothetical protein